LAKIENWQVVSKMNFLRVDVMVAHLDFIANIIKDNHWAISTSVLAQFIPGW
jgi:hypothetical protein